MEEAAAVIAQAQADEAGALLAAVAARAEAAEAVAESEQIQERAARLYNRLGVHSRTRRSAGPAPSASSPANSYWPRTREEQRPCLQAPRRPAIPAPITSVAVPRQAATTAEASVRVHLAVHHGAVGRQSQVSAPRPSTGPSCMIYAPQQVRRMHYFAPRASRSGCPRVIIAAPSDGSRDGHPFIRRYGHSTHQL